MMDKDNVSVEEKDYNQIIEEITVARAWGMSELSNWLSDMRARLRNHTSAEGIWYLMIPEGNSISPSVFKEEDTDGSMLGSPTIFRRVERSVESFFAEREGELSDLREYETIARMTIECPDKYSSMISWSGSIRSCLRNAIRINSIYTGEYRLYIFSPSKYMALRNESRKRKEVTNDGVFDSLNMAAIVFESDIENAEYSRYLHGKETESQAAELETIKDGYNDTTLNEKQIIEYLPVPLSFVSMGQNGRFLAYDMMIPQNISRKSRDSLSLEALQKTLLYLGANDQDMEGNRFRLYVEEEAFLYSIRLDKDTLNQITDLIDEQL